MIYLLVAKSNSSFDLDKLAKLASLPISTDEKQVFSAQLSDIIKYIEQLNSVDTSNIEPTFNTTGKENITQEDSPKPSLSQEEALSNTPNSKNGLFVTKGVFTEE
jgi:aspartyl-tRNA(Asn)/glutamyl-tRNA(Gln) amidotransferase subunit C